MPLTKTLRAANEDTFGNRLDELARALQVSHIATEESRKFNRRRLQKRANARDIRVGDTVVMNGDDQVSFTSRWDPQWEVTRVSGPVDRVRHQQSVILTCFNFMYFKVILQFVFKALVDNAIINERLYTN